MATTKDGLPARCWAYRPNPDLISSWKLRLCSDNGTIDASHVGAACAAIPGGGTTFRGQNAAIPRNDLAGVREKLRAAWRRVHPGEPDSAMPAGCRP
jgi:hypothetical protein